MAFLYLILLSGYNLCFTCCAMTLYFIQFDNTEQIVRGMHLSRGALEGTEFCTVLQVGPCRRLYGTGMMR